MFGTGAQHSFSKKLEPIRDTTYARLIGAVALAIVLEAMFYLLPDRYTGILRGINSLPSGSQKAAVAATGLDSAISHIFDWLELNVPAILGFLLGLWRGKALSGIVHWVRVHGGFKPDDEVLTPIPQPSAYDPLWGSGLGSSLDKDPCLPWIEPKFGTKRRALLDALSAFAREEMSDGSHPSWKRPEDPEFVDFRWAVLVGHTGAGKTRMAVEFLRRELAQSERFEGLNAPGLWTQRWMALSEWTRRILPRLKRLPDDPWDIGWIQPTFEENKPRAHRHRRIVQKAYSDKLEDWRPRRPTALLLDDPKSGDSMKIVEILNTYREKYHFPVRLIVVNQTVPPDLFEFDKDTEPKPRFDRGRLLQFNVQADLGPTDIQQIITDLAKRNLFLRSPEIANDPDIGQKIYDITDGNAMLVELAIHCLLHRIPIDTLTAESLIDERVKRVVQSLRMLHEFGANDYRMLASVTIAGPEIVGDSDLLREFEDEEHHLRGCFNLAHKMNMNYSLPAVRPERVGDAYVRWVFEEYKQQENKLAEVVPRAWRQNPAGVLRTVARAAAQGDDLGEALRMEPPALPNGITLDPSETAMAYATAAAHTPFGQRWPLATMNALIIACDRIRRLTPTQCDELLPKLANGLLQAAPNLIRIRYMPIAYCYLNALRNRLDQSQLQIKATDISRLLADAERVVEEWAFDAWLFEDENANAINALLKLASVADSIIATPSTGTENDDQLDRARAWCLVAEVGAKLAELSGCESAVRKVEALASAIQGERSAVIQARALMSLCLVLLNIRSRIGDCESAAQKVERLLSWYSGQGSIIVRVRTQKFLCLALSHHLPERLKDYGDAANKVDDLAARFHSRELLYDQIDTRAYQCKLNYINGTPGSEALAKSIDKLVTGPPERRLALLQASA